MKKIVIIILIATVILLSGAYTTALPTTQTLAQSTKASSNNPQTDYVAMVGKEKITVYEYKFFLANVRTSIEQAVGIGSQTEEMKKFWSGKLGNTTAQEYAKQQALSTTVEFKIQIIKAKEEGLKLSKSDYDKVTSYINQLIKNYGGRNEADKAIKNSYGIGIDQLNIIYEESILVDKFVATEKGKIKPSSSQLKYYYSKSMEAPGKITTVKHILISTMDETGTALSDDQIAEKKKLAEDVLSLVNTGSDFNDLVEKYSDDPGSKNTGGEYTFGKGEMVKEFEDWAFSAKPGDTGIIKSTYGFHIMKKPTFEEELSTVTKKYLDYAYNNKMSEWKKDKKYAVIKNNAVYAKITIF